MQAPWTELPCLIGYFSLSIHIIIITWAWFLKGYSYTWQMCLILHLKTFFTPTLALCSIIRGFGLAYKSGCFHSLCSPTITQPQTNRILTFTQTVKKKIHFYLSACNAKCSPAVSGHSTDSKWREDPFKKFTIQCDIVIWTCLRED